MKRFTHRRGSGRRALKLIVAAAALVLVMVVVYQGGRWLETKDVPVETRGNHLQRLEYDNGIEIDGVSYKERKNITTILLMGVDKDSDAKTGLRHGGQSDFLRLLIIDHDAKSVQQVPIDRDTMTPIATFGVLGDYTGKREAQICLSYGYGDGREMSCELTRTAVSDLFFGKQIDFYMSLNMDGIDVLNDWVGGVEVTLEDDFTSVDPTMTKGRTMTLVGEQAETYVRSRMSVGVGTNESRMKRQQDYIAKLSDQLMERVRADQSAIGLLYDELTPYMVTNIPRGRLINEAWAAKDFSTTTVGVPGEHRVGDSGFMEFYLDESELQRMSLELFYYELK